MFWCSHRMTGWSHGVMLASVKRSLRVAAWPGLGLVALMVEVRWLWKQRKLVAYL